MFDSHAHYDDRKFDADRYELLDRLFSGNIEYIVNNGSDIESSKKSIELTRRYNGMYAAVGIHPHEAKGVSSGYLDILRELLSDPKTVAIGEIGLDYHYDFSPRDIQKRVFAEQMQLAEEMGFPVVVHDREAHAECLEVVKAFPKVNGVFHCFSGSVETAKSLTDRGWKLGIGGSLTFKNAQTLPNVVRSIPEGSFMLETDCPYMTPVPHRGERNNSGMMIYVAEKIAELRGTTAEKIIEMTSRTAKDFFGII